MNFVRRHWYDIGAFIAAPTSVYAFVNWHQVNRASLLLLLNFVALLIHQYEEYGWPGGEPAIMNIVLQGSEKPDRYPLNQNSAMIINVIAAYLFYLIPVFFPKVIWLGIAPTLFGFGQFIIHGIVTPKKLGSFYNPGLGAVVLLHYPIGIAYLYYIHAHGIVTVFDWVSAVVYLGAFQFLTLKKMTYTWLVDKDSKYPFAPEEMRRFGVAEKMNRQ